MRVVAIKLQAHNNFLYRDTDIDLTNITQKLTLFLNQCSHQLGAYKNN